MYTQRPNNYRGNSERPWRGSTRGEYRGRGVARGEWRGRGANRGERGNYSNRPYHENSDRSYENRGYNKGYNNKGWEEAKIEEDNIDDDGVIELTLTDEQMVIFEAKKEYARENLSVKLDEDDIARICHTCDFNEARIDKKLESYATNNKYEGMEAFEW